MGIIASLFSAKPNPDKFESQLIAPCHEVCDEIDRCYRNHLRELDSRYGGVSITGVGLLKARLFGSSIMANAHGVKFRDPTKMRSVIKTMSGVAIAPFRSGAVDYPSITNEQANSFASQYTMDVIEAAMGQIGHAISTTTLNSLYCEALLDSCDENVTEEKIQDEMGMAVGGMVHLTTSHMMRWAA